MQIAFFLSWSLLVFDIGGSSSFGDYLNSSKINLSAGINLFSQPGDNLVQGCYFETNHCYVVMFTTPQKSLKETAEGKQQQELIT